MKPLFRIAALALICLLMVPKCLADGSEFSEEQLLADYDCLWDVLEAEYPFWPLLEGVDARALREEYRERAGQCRDAGALLALLTDQLRRTGNPAHLGMLSPATFAQYRELIRQGVLGPDAPEYPLITAPGTIRTYEALSGASPGVSGEPRSPEVFLETEAILRVHFHSFAQERLERDRGVVAEALAACPEVRHIIFDITGNRGGSDYYWMENIVAPFGGRYVLENALYLRDTPLNRSYGLMDGAKPVDGSAPPFAAQLGLTHVLRESLALPAQDSAVETVPCAARRWLLIDEGVYSAADSFAAFCRETGWATVVGRPTSGDGGFARPALVRLPNTGLLARFSTATASNRDGTPNSLTGTRPAYLCKPGETPLGACLRRIGEG